MRFTAIDAHHRAIFLTHALPLTLTPKQCIGAAGEVLARRHLEREGLVLIAANVRYRVGEIDLVMRDVDGTIAFVEVRRRTRPTYGGAAASITHFKRDRLIAAAAHYIAMRRLSTRPCRFDVITIEGPDEKQRIEWMRDAFRPGD